jgi:hypothetical protein
MAPLLAELGAASVKAGSPKVRTIGNSAASPGASRPALMVMRWMRTEPRATRTSTTVVPPPVLFNVTR